MSQFYFEDNVYVASLKNVEGYLGEKKDGSSINSDESLILSSSYKKVLSVFLSSLKEKNQELLSFFWARLENPLDDIIKIQLLSLHQKRTDIIAQYPNYKMVLSDGGLSFFKMDQLFFLYWQKLARFATIDDEGTDSLERLKPKMLFVRKSLFHIFYSWKRNLLLKPISVEKDYSVGFLAGFVLARPSISYPDEYSYLEKVPFISSANLNLPYSYYSKRNKRIGVYEECPVNPLLDKNCLDEKTSFCLPLKCGSALVYLYFSYKFAPIVLGCLNLFEKASIDECDKKPDIMIVFGGKEGKSTGTYYHDKENGMMIGYVSSTDEADYFGYVKKLILTLYNIMMIEKGSLPIHGSMVSLTLKGGKSFNLVIMGDSGAGKSESIEAFRSLASEYLERLTIVFDDMGTLHMKDDKVVASGTEIGAFVRLDDLDEGYAFSHLNDALMYNLGENNSRLVYSCTPYEEVVASYPVDCFLYANNYERNDDGLSFIDVPDVMVKVAEEGKRKAKGTTGEVGLVSSYFANPFGPVQLKDKCHPLVQSYFHKMKEEGTRLGVLYTELGIEGEEKKGPERAARKLFDYLLEEKQ